MIALSPARLGGSPSFPASWTPQVFEAAYQHAIEAYPKEAAGMVVDGDYVRLDNLSTSPDHDVVLSDADLIRVANAELFFHSHPDAPACPSEQDMLYQEQLGIPFVVICLPVFDLFCWGDMLQRAPLLGRSFRHGINDCYSLVRDFYDEYGIAQLPGKARGWGWWNKNQNLYVENFERANFVAIPPDEAVRNGDLLLFKFTFPVPMHAAIVIERDLLMHHMSGDKPYDPTRLSVAVPRTRLIRHAVMGLRQK
jgi:proteasome lid subunit RPN8/RPN11